MAAARVHVDGPPDRIFRLYATCKLVKGGAYSAIYDLDRRLLFRFDTAYHSLFLLAAAEKGLAMSEVELLDQDVQSRAMEAIEFMTAREVGRFMDPMSSALLVPMADSWDSPHPIINAIIDVDEREPDWPTVLDALDGLKCRGLQVRGFSQLLDTDRVMAVLELLQGRGISHVDFVVKWTAAWDLVDWATLFQAYRNLQAVRIHSAPRALEINSELSPALVGRLVTYETTEIGGASHCGAIAEGSLSIPSPALYSELRSFNGCLNRKVSIRADGNICNCPSMRATFGTDLGRLREIVASSAFQAPWRLRKDELAVCAGCEFRYVCTDCRAYLESDVSRGKPAKCSYDPTTGCWGTTAMRVA